MNPATWRRRSEPAGDDDEGSLIDLPTHRAATRARDANREYRNGRDDRPGQARTPGIEAALVHVCGSGDGDGAERVVAHERLE